ncbi:armadillo repeat-containing protein 7 isoform X2 [Myotis daubentonii]|uniref:armadillo repeat-containing protein 7 isoform X2 n=1 Tax=Myotis daubentonii TaxID=98922 RepID=UPI00287345EF|nr:armadillo repeat-containing protein 7 isoform X2 [Myotis daubentonii]
MAQKPKVDPHVGRLGYLQALVTEFQETESQDAKEQVLANLANFAYDPSNYQYLRQLQVLDLFLDSLSEENETLVEFAIGDPAAGANAGVHCVFSPGSHGTWPPPAYPWDGSGGKSSLAQVLSGTITRRWYCSRRPLQPVLRQGQQGAHPADRGRPAHHQLPVQPQRGDCAVRCHHHHVPELARPRLPPRADRHARGPVHAALLSLGQHAAPEPGPGLPGRLLFPEPGGRSPPPAGSLCPGHPTAKDRGPTAALTHGDLGAAVLSLPETRPRSWWGLGSRSSLAPTEHFPPLGAFSAILKVSVLGLTGTGTGCRR